MALIALSRSSIRAIAASASARALVSPRAIAAAVSIAPLSIMRSVPRQLLALFGLVAEQLRDLEAMLLHAPDDLRQPLRVRPEHRPAAMTRPAIAIDPPDDDIGSELDHALLEARRVFFVHR